MKHSVIPLFAFTFILHLASAAVPLRWTVETSRVQPATFDAYQGETLTFEAALQSYGKPLAAPSEYAIYWQTNGMGSAWWVRQPAWGGDIPVAAESNVLYATFSPDMDCGAKVYSCFIGLSNSIYRAAFQLRLRPSPGAIPNELPLPQKVIDFSKVTVLNPPWSGGGGSGGVDTNAVLDIIHKTVEGSARYTPKYLWVYDCDDTYPKDAAWYYAQPQDYGSCSAVRDGGFLYRNYDWHFDSSAEFVVRVSAGLGRFSSIGVANCGTNLTEIFVTSGKTSRYYKCLPGRVVDGINENGVVCEVNVVDGDPHDYWDNPTGDIHPLAAVRWTLDNAMTAEDAATNLAARIAFPPGWTQNFHWMLADERETWIVENGAASNVTAVAAKRVMTNFPILPDIYFGSGYERYDLLRNGESITNAWFTLAYSSKTVPIRNTEFKTPEEMNAAMSAWETHAREELRGKGLWQTVHTSIYDINNRTLRISVQETDDWYIFALPVATGVSPGGVDTNGVREIVTPMIVSATNGLRRVDDLAVYTHAYSKWTHSPVPPHEGTGFNGPDEGIEQPYFLPENGNWYWGDWYSHGSEDAKTLIFSPDGDGRYYPFTATRTTSFVPGSDTLSTSNGVAAAIANKADREELQPIATAAEEAKDAANEANVWSSSVYNFMTGGRTNCWFSGTNYVFGSDAATRQRFTWEDGMDAVTVPCSMALWEIRDGVRQLVWDQRDWTAWYWSFKAEQMAADIQGRIDALGNAVTNTANYAWAKRYASDGTPNPDASTTFIDTPSVTLSPGMKWETVATVSGAAYWTIVGNGAVIGGTGTNAVLRIMDFEGNDIMTVTKGEHRLAWLESGEITGNMYDSNGWVCFDMLADAEPIGYFSTTLEMSDFLPQTDQNCPAQYRWENIGGGKYRVHFLLKPGIQANACFAKFQVEVEGQTVIRYNAGHEISGGLIYNGVKIAPDISGTPAVGTVIQWKVVH